MNILLIEDDPTTARSIELMLARAGMQVAGTPFGAEGLDLARIGEYDLILLDLGLPDIPGLEVLRRLRAGHIGTPVLVLTGSDDGELALRSFDSGATDFLPKPFSLDGLVTCIQAAHRRVAAEARAVIRVGRLGLNLKTGTATVDGKPLLLSGREAQVFDLLARRKGSTVTKEMLLDHLYAGGPEPDAKIVDVLICNLRKKLAAALEGETGIYTIWGRGYMLQEPGQVERLAG